MWILKEEVVTHVEKYDLGYFESNIIKCKIKNKIFKKYTSFQFYAFINKNYTF